MSPQGMRHQARLRNSQIDYTVIEAFHEAMPAANTEALFSAISQTDGSIWGKKRNPTVFCDESKHRILDWQQGINVRDIRWAELSQRSLGKQNDHDVPRLVTSWCTPVICFFLLFRDGSPVLCHIWGLNTSRHVCCPCCPTVMKRLVQDNILCLSSYCTKVAVLSDDWWKFCVPVCVCDAFICFANFIVIVHSFFFPLKERPYRCRSFDVAMCG